MSEMDRFVEFLRRAAAEYNSPPPTPRDDMWGRIETSVFAGDMADQSTIDEAASDREMDRFVEFLGRAAAEYNVPPATPRDDMWDEIESTLALETADETDGSRDDALSVAADIYHTPPLPPREEMWSRIEAAWQMRRPVPDQVDDAPSGPASHRRRAMVIAGLAIAASLVIGIAIGRRSAEQLRPDASTTTVAQGVTGAEGEPVSAPSGPTGSIEIQTPGELARAQDPATQAGETRSEPQDAAPGGARLTALEPQRLDTAPGERGGAPANAPSRRDVVIHYATTEYLGRAEALLTTFRTEPDAGDGEISKWARELLAETRLLMDLPADRDRRTTALLRELEFVLASIAGLGDDAPSGERALVADGLVQRGVLPRLRAAIPSGPAGAVRVGT